MQKITQSITETPSFNMARLSAVRRELSPIARALEEVVGTNSSIIRSIDTVLQQSTQALIESNTQNETLKTQLSESKVYLQSAQDMFTALNDKVDTLLENLEKTYKINDPFFSSDSNVMLQLIQSGASKIKVADIEKEASGVKQELAKPIIQAHPSTLKQIAEQIDQLQSKLPSTQATPTSITQTVARADRLSKVIEADSPPISGDSTPKAG